MLKTPYIAVYLFQRIASSLLVLEGNEEEKWCPEFQLGNVLLSQILEVVSQYCAHLSSHIGTDSPAYTAYDRVTYRQSKVALYCERRRLKWPVTGKIAQPTGSVTSA